MQLEYIFQQKGHARYGEICIVCFYSAIPNDDSISVMFDDGIIVETKRNKIISRHTMHIRKGRTIKKAKAIHPKYDTQIKFASFMQNKQKLKRYLQQHNITMNDLFNTFIANL